MTWDELVSKVYKLGLTIVEINDYYYIGMKANNAKWKLFKWKQDMTESDLLRMTWNDTHIHGILTKLDNGSYQMKVKEDIKVIKQDKIKFNVR